MLPKCVICVRPLDDIFLIDPWGNQFHERHDTQTPICFSCGRVISKATSHGGRRLLDGRFICGICGQTSVSTGNQVRNARDSALKILSSIGIRDFPREVGIRLVDRLELNKLTKGMSLHTQGEMRGLTKSVETLEGNRRVSTRHTIFLLQNLPALELQGILAHELMHVWLFEKNIKLSLREAEGFCNLGNYLVFSRNPSAMASYLLKKLETDKDPVYGEGFRLQKSKLNKLGWLRFLANITSG
ncbi:MAG: protein DA1 [Opitutae bacterium]|nr:protein DA1 [Opitutae bacterium]MBT5379519.1 protein DA1 [Opitutae bacterium]MBT5691098.1 protein DA1 [Opitutae bacterium]MBT6462406.1 protein DA1 [Opitutae bacterium]MBT6957762.1 protein DA1 [Opitutae bacterium]